MSVFNNGILGGFAGKTGGVIGSTWKGKSTMRALPKIKKSRKFSPGQEDQQEKFKLMVNLLSGLSKLFAITFKRHSKSVSGFNAAVAYNIRQAVSGDASPFGIDTTRLQFSGGNSAMPTVNNLVATAEANQQIGFTWIKNPGVGRALNSDKVIVVVYSEADNQFTYYQDTATRGDEMATVDVAVFANQEVHCWLLLVSEDQTASSSTAYAGKVSLID